MGPDQARIYRIVDALDGERVDVLPWSPVADRMIRNALAPMHVVAVTLDPALGCAVVTVGPTPYDVISSYGPEHRELASRLSGWEISIVDPDAA